MYAQKHVLDEPQLTNIHQEFFFFFHGLMIFPHVPTAGIYCETTGVLTLAAQFYRSSESMLGPRSINRKHCKTYSNSKRISQ